MNFADILETHARTRLAHPAIEEGDRTVSYKALLSNVLTVETNLTKAGIRPGHVVGVMLPSSTAHLVTLFALARLGAVALSIDGPSSEPEKRSAIESFNVKTVISVEGAPIPTGIRLVDVGELFLGGLMNPPAFASMFDARRPMLVVQSAGTTGTPKRFFISHEVARQRFPEHEEEVGIGASDRFLFVLDMAFFSSLRRCMATLVLGATVVFSQAKSLDALILEVAARRITWMTTTPTFVRQFLALAHPDALLFPSLKILTVTGSWMSPEDRTRARDQLCPNIVERYGTSEAGTLAIAHPEDQDAQPESVGRVSGRVEAEIVDEDNRALPPGTVGRLRVRTPYMPTEYHENPQATAKAFEGGWFYPGDLAAIDQEGYLFLRGRADDVINNGGVKFYPVEVERALTAHPAVAEAAVVAWKHTLYGEVAFAFVVAVASVTERELTKHCHGRIADYKVPHHIEFVGDLPKNARGKVMKADLRQRAKKHKAA